MIAPKVSICIPAYRQPDLLQRTLESIFSQDYTDYEVIITDDSPDTSVEEAFYGFKTNRENLIYVKNAERKGTPENWNEAIRHASGEYIKLLHHDDWFPNRDCLGAFVALLDNYPEADFAFSGSSNYDLQGNLKFTHRARPRQIHRLRKDPSFVFWGNFVGAPSATIYRRSLNLFFDPKLKYVVDMDFYMRALQVNNNFNFTYKPLVAITVGSENQVTASCVYNKAVDLFENLYLYEKISSISTLDYGKSVHLLNLLERYKVKSQQDLIDCGYPNPIGPGIQSILKLPRIYKLILKASHYPKTLLSWTTFIRRHISFFAGSRSKKLKRNAP